MRLACYGVCSGFAKIPFCFVCATSTAEHRNSSYSLNAESGVILYSATAALAIRISVILDASDDLIYSCSNGDEASELLIYRPVITHL